VRVKGELTFFSERSEKLRTKGVKEDVEYVAYQWNIGK
jgi:hypothetical protein